MSLLPKDCYQTHCCLALLWALDPCAQWGNLQLNADSANLLSTWSWLNFTKASYCSVREIRVLFISQITAQYDLCVDDESILCWLHDLHIRLDQWILASFWGSPFFEENLGMKLGKPRSQWPSPVFRLPDTRMVKMGRAKYISRVNKQTNKQTNTNRLGTKLMLNADEKQFREHYEQFKYTNNAYSSSCYIPASLVVKTLSYSPLICSSLSFSILWHTTVTCLSVKSGWSLPVPPLPVACDCNWLWVLLEESSLANTFLRWRRFSSCSTWAKSLSRIK